MSQCKQCLMKSNLQTALKNLRHVAVCYVQCVHVYISIVHVALMQSSNSPKESEAVAVCYVQCVHVYISIVHVALVQSSNSPKESEAHCIVLCTVCI